MKPQQGPTLRHRLARTGLALVGLGLLTATLMGGCSIRVEDDDEPTLGDAFSDLGRAFGNTWDDFTDWLGQVF